MTEPPLPTFRPLTSRFLKRDTQTVAKSLLGALMLRRLDQQWIGGRIVETEAYLHHGDHASHSARGLGTSNASMFEVAGTIYVYPIHAKVCFNVVTGPKHAGAAVLVRALEPLWGIELMSKNRGLTLITRLTSGPSMLCQALAIDRSYNGRSLSEETDLILCRPETKNCEDVGVSPRIGISKGTDLPLRFFLRGNRFVSGPKSWHRI